MKKLYVSFLIYLFPFSLIFAQPNDCCTADELQSAGTVLVTDVIGFGKQEEVSGCSCLGDDEHNSYWFKFDAPTGGQLTFIVDPTSGVGDFDFALFQGGCPCEFSEPTDAIACDFTTPPGPPFGPTGIGNPGGFGYPGAPQFIQAIDLIEGETYFLLIDNKADPDGFRLQFGPGVDIGQLPDPGPAPLTGPTQLCPGETGSYMVPPGSIGQVFRWTVSPTNGPPINILTNELDYTFEDPGSYELCASFVNDGCFLSDPTCMTVDVIPLPITQVSEVLCFPGPYIAGNGEEFFSPGVYTLTLESEAGCDSIVILTLDGGFSDLEVRAETICDGDCFEFEGELLCSEGIYEKVYTNVLGCDSVISLNLIKIPLEIEVAGEDTLTCNKTSLTLNAGQTLAGGETSFLWKNESGDTLVADSVLFVNGPGIYTIQVTTIVDTDTCVDEKDIEIIEDAEPPVAVFANGGTLFCNENFVVLQGGTTSDSVSYSWSGPNGFFSTEQNPTVFVPGSYTLTVTNLINGCTETATAVVDEIIETLVVNAEGATINCYSSSVTLNGSSPAQNVSYAWEGPNGTMYAGPNPLVNEPGIYTLTVTDADGCIGTAEALVDVDITQPEASASADQLLNCNTTSVFLNGSGSSFGPAFSYAWTTNNGIITSGGNTLNPTVSAIGVYTLTVTNDINGCTNTALVEVFASPEVTAAIDSQSDVLCFGENNGSAIAQGDGGDGVFTYDWSNGMIGNTVNNLSEGNYVVTVTDGVGCTATASVDITQPSVLLANASSTAQTMQGVNDGTANASPSGGTPDYTFLWNNGMTTQTIDGLAPGNYTVTVTDANGCESTQTVTVNEIECFVGVAINQTDVSCNGLGDGAATAILTNAAEPVSFIWSNDDTTQTIDGLAPGSYDVTATDANGCEVVASATIIEPSELNVNATSTDQIIPGSDDGTATANPTGGTAPYTFLWSNDETTSMITGLAPGEYTVTVTDTNDCTEAQTVTVEEFNCGVALDIDFENVSCNGSMDGQATALPSGGLAPFTFEWSNGDTTPIIGNLSAGTYDVTVVDAGNCPIAGQVVISEPNELLLETTNVMAASCGSDDGSAAVAASGGTPDYIYEWSNGVMAETADNLAAGTYTVSVVDANTCLATLEIEIAVDSTSDNELPEVVTENVSIELDENGTASISAMDVDAGSFDNCEIASITLDISNFDCSNLGVNTVTLTVVDLAGNANSATAEVTVEDNSPPAFENCPSNIILPFCDPVAFFDIIATDNCSDGLSVEQSSGLPSGSTFPAGEITAQTFEVSDLSGNTATCTFEVSVAATISVNATLSDITCFGEADGSIAVNVMGGSPDYTYLWNNDSTGVSVGNLEPGIYTLTITDASGCESIHEYEIEEPEGLTTTLVNIINETNNDQNGSVEVDVSGGVMPYTFEWTDLNGNVVGNAEDIDSLAAGTYQLFVTDANGCVSSSAYTIQNSTPTIDPALDALIKVFPNPARNWLVIEFVDLPISEIEFTLHDVVGRSVLGQKNAVVSNGQYTIDMKELAGGVYLLKLNIEESIVTKRIVRVD